jgi:hypothetical protein
VHEPCKEKRLQQEDEFVQEDVRKPYRRIFFIAFPFASSSTSLSR